MGLTAGLCSVRAVAIRLLQLGSGKSVNYYSWNSTAAVSS